jgi:hypothetical protein
MRIQTGCCASTSPRAPTCRCIPPPTLRRSRPNSTPDPAKPSTGKHRPNASINYSHKLIDHPCCNDRWNPPHEFRPQLYWQFSSMCVNKLSIAPLVPVDAVRQNRRRYTVYRAGRLGVSGGLFTLSNGAPGGRLGQAARRIGQVSASSAGSFFEEGDEEAALPAVRRSVNGRTIWFGAG